jgi:hypothetical protein
MMDMRGAVASFSFWATVYQTLDSARNRGSIARAAGISAESYITFRHAPIGDHRGSK